MARTNYGKYLEEQGYPQEVLEAQEQFVPTRGEMPQMIHEALNNNPDRKKAYTPDFKLCKEYLALKDEKNKAEKAGDWKKAQELSEKMLNIQLSGTVTNEEKQAEIDKTLEMPIADILKERKKYKKIILECEEKIDNFDVSPVEAEVDALTAEYDQKLRGKHGMTFDVIKAEYEKAVDELERKLVIIPMNEIALRRYKAKEYFLIYEARVKYYIAANRALIDEEIQNAKRMEVRGSLVDLVAYMEDEEKIPLSSREEFMEGAIIYD